MDEFDFLLDTALDAFAPPPGLQAAMLRRVTGRPPTPREARRRTAEIFRVCFGELADCVERGGSAASLQWMA